MSRALLKKLVSSILLTFALVSCAGRGPIGGSTGLQVLSSAALPAPTVDDFKNVERAYAIGPYDKLRIDVVGLPELSLAEVQTDAGGNIGVPLVGSVRVAGMTTSEAAHLISERLRAAYVRDPKVAVNLRETVSQVMTIEGQVKRPGQFPATAGMTLLSAVAKAEGTSEFAKLQEVIVFRTVGAQRYAGVYDLRAIRRGAYADPAIFANDVIVVGDSPQRRRFLDFIQLIPLLTTPLIIALQNN